MLPFFRPAAFTAPIALTQSQDIMDVIPSAVAWVEMQDQGIADILPSGFSFAEMDYIESVDVGAATGIYTAFSIIDQADFSWDSESAQAVDSALVSFGIEDWILSGDRYYLVLEHGLLSDFLVFDFTSDIERDVLSDSPDLNNLRLSVKSEPDSRFGDTAYIKRV